MRTVSLLISRLAAILNSGRQGLLARSAGFLCLAGLLLGALPARAVPTVTSIDVPANGTYGPSDGTLTFMVHFSESVRIANAAPGLILNVGGVEVTCGSLPAYFAGSFSAFPFRYTVAPGHLDTDGIQISRLVILQGDAFRNGGGEAADLTLPALPSTAGILVDGIGPVVSTISLASASDLGASNSDRITSDNTPTIFGLTEPGATVSILAPVNGATTADGAGNWSFTFAAMSEGTKSLFVGTTDSHGNQTYYPSLGIYVDTVAPAPPSLALAAFTDTGALGDRITFSTQPQFGGVAETNSTVALVRDGGLVATTTADGSGNFTVTDPGPVSPGVHVYQATATDVAGNASALSGNRTITIDNIPPVAQSITRADANPSNAGTVHFNATFSEAVNSLDVGDFSIAAGGIAGASVTDVSGSGASYTVTVNTGSGSGSLQLNLNPAANIYDPAGNLGGSAFAGETYIIDRDPPVVLSIIKADANPTGAATVNFTVTFREAVSGVSAANFMPVPSGGLTGASITSVSGSGTGYTVTASTGTGSGSLGLNLVNSTGLTDGVGNPATIPFTGEVYTVDKSSPVIASVSVPPDGTYLTGQTLEFTVTPSEPVLVAGQNAALGLVFDSGPRSAAYVADSPSTALKFRYTVQAGDADYNGIAVDGALSLNGATIRDFTGNNLVLTVNGLPSTAGIRIGPQGPRVTASLGLPTYVENAAPVVVDDALTVVNPSPGDPETGKTASALVSITSGFQDLDFLAIPDAVAQAENISAIYDPQHGTLTINCLGGFNAPDSMERVLRAVTFVHNSEAPGSSHRIFVFTVTAPTGASSQASRMMNVAAVNDPPTLAVPASITVVEDSIGSADSVLTGVTVGDPDAGAAGVTVAFSAPVGTLHASPGAGVSVTGSGTSVLALSGTVADLNAFIAAGQVSYLTAPDSTAGVTLDINVNDGGNTGEGGVLAVAATLPIVVTGVNDVPVVLGPASIGVGDAPAPMTAVSFADPDAGSGQVEVHFVVNPGAIVGPSTALVSAVRGSGPESISLSGSLADINDYLAAGSLIYTPPPGLIVDGLMDASLRDHGNTGTGGEQFAQRRFTLVALNDPPVISRPGTITVTEDVASPLTGITLSDPDAGASVVTAVLDVSAGTLTAISGNGVTVAGAGTSTLALGGTIADLNAFITASQITYLTVTNATAAVTLGISVDDGGNTGGGGPQTGLATTVLSVIGMNDAPRVILPPVFPVTEDVPSSLIGIIFSDVDHGGDLEQATFTVSSGVLTAENGGGVTVSGSGTGTLVITGTLPDLAAFGLIGGVKYTTVRDATDGGSLTVTLDDLGNSGTDPGASGTATSEAGVASTLLFAFAVNDPPVNTVPPPQSTLRNLSLVFSAANGNAITVSDVDGGALVARTTLTAANGLISLSGTSGLSFLVGSGFNESTMTVAGTLADINVALNGLTFVPTPGYDGPASLQITSDDRGSSGSGGAQTDTDTIDIAVRPNPRIVSTGTTKPDGLYPAGEVIALTVQLEQVVFVDTTVGTPTLLLETGTTDRQATYVSGSGTDTLTFNYTVQPGDVAADLDYESTAALALNGATIRNVVGDDAVLTLAAPGSAGSISGAHALVIDGVAPVIASVEAPPNAAYRAGQHLDFTARFAETVTVDTTGGTPRLPLTLNGGGTVFANYLGGSGPDALVFRFTVAAGQDDTDGVTVGAALGLNGGVISDVAGNPAVLALNNVAPTTGVQVDTTAPVANISSPSAVLTRSGPVTYTVTYTDALFNLSTLAVADITLNRTGSANAATVTVTGSGNTRTVTLAGITGDGTLGISVGANTATDTSGNLAAPAGPSAPFEVDNTPPAVALSGPTVGATRGGPVSYTVTYTDLNFNASTLASGDISLNRTGNANASSVVVTGSGAIRTVTLSGITGDGTLGISLAAGTATDAAGNSALAVGPSATFIVDNTLPVVTLSAPSASITKGGPVSYTVTYTDLNFSASTLAVANIIVNKTGTANAGTVVVAGSGTTRTVTLSGIIGDGTLGISLAAGTASDTAGNLAPVAGPATTFTVDNTPPSITLGAPSLNLTRGGPVTYAITYADPNFSASALAVADVVLNRTGTANAGTMAVSGAGTTRMVTLSGITGDGTLGISLVAGTASDTAGNLALATGAAATFTVDNTPPAAPVIASITADTGISASDRVTADTSLVLSGTAEPGATAILTHAVNGVLGNAVVNAGGEWVFDYAATTLGEGMHEFTAVARDPAGNTSVASVVFSVRIDTTDPVVATLSGPPAGGYGNGRYLDIAVTFSEPVLVDTTSGVPGLEILAGAKPRVALYQSGSGGATWVFRYVVQSDETGMGLSSSQPIRLNGGTIKDVAGNNAVLATPGLNVPGILFDGLPPEITISEPSAALTRRGPVTYRVSYRDPNFYSTTLTESDVVLNRTGTATGTVDMVNPLDPLDNFRTVVINNINGDGTLSLSIKPGSASDRAGNSAPAAGPGPVVLVDNTPPVAPVLTGISLDSGVSGADQITSDRSLLISGTAEPRSLVTVTRESVGEAGKVTADSAGQWTLDYRDTTLADGTYKFSAEATDAVGNTSPVSITMTVIVDNQAPVVTLSAPSVPVVGYRGSVSYVVTYTDANLVTGTLKATDISLVKTGAVEGEILVAGAGLATWTVTIANLTGNGTVTIALAPGSVSDAAGNLAPAAQASAAVQVDALPPSAPVITLLDPTEDGFGSEQVTRNPRPVLHGKADPGATVLLYLDEDDEHPLGDTPLLADVNGNWIYSHTGTPLNEGAHHFRAQARDLGGNLSPYSEPFSVTLDTVAPTVTLSGPSRSLVDTAGVVVTYEAKYADLNLGSVSLSAADVILNTTGSAKGNVLVSVFGDTRVITITNLSGAGTIGISLRAGTAVDLAGNLAPLAGPSATFQVNLVSLEAGLIGSGGGGILIQGIGLPGAVYEVQATEILNPPNWVTVATVNARADGAFVFQEFVASGRSRFYRVIAR